MICLHCNKETKNLKFCSSSCAASVNNKGIRRHGKPKNLCKICGLETKTSKQKYCSIKCANSVKIKYFSDEDRLEAVRKQNRESRARYDATKKYNTPCDENINEIRKFYNKCPVGYEVDHIIPISKGGLHTLSNLQYLTISENRSKGNRLDWNKC